MVRIYGFPKFIFQQKIRWIASTTRGPGGTAQVHGGPTRADKRVQHHFVGARHAGARARRSSPTMAKEDEPDEAVPEGVLTGARAAAERRYDRGEEWW
jgi:hypothetical protein